MPLSPPVENKPGARAPTIEEVLAQLGSSADGLASAEVERRRQQYGPNAIEEAPARPWLKLLGFLWGPIPWMIEAAAILSVIAGDWSDFGIIATMLAANAGIGFWQEYKADNAIATLKRRLALKARVRRDGQWTNCAAADLVPGDIVRVRLGDIVPADLRSITPDEMEVDQSALTGESLPVEKAAGDVLYSGSIIRQGEADAVVTATGMTTYFGRTAKLVESAHTVSHYQRAVMRIGRYLIVLTLALVGVILVFAVIRSESLLETVQFCLILTVAAIPVALPAVLSVTMAIGAVALAKRQAIVSRLVSLEELAGLDVLCSDKTGTLTQNRLVLGEPVVIGGDGVDLLLRDAALASREEDQDPIEAAIFERAKGDGAVRLDGYERVSFRPFDPVIKRTEAEVARDGAAFKVSKGAPQVILALCGGAAGLSERVMAAVDEMGRRGDRALGVARTGPDGKWSYEGLLPLHDPPREDSAETIRAARELGIDVKMLTGDHRAIALEIARQLDLGSRIFTADEVFGPDGKADEAKLLAADGLAQVFPEHKFRLVTLLQQAGHFVGMTGDGVNDAPALKKANAGIAVSGATDAARSAADLVLTAPGLSVIIDAVKEARRIFERMTSYAIYRIAETTRVLLFMSLSILLLKFYPVTALMIVILALLNDGPIMMIAYDHTKVAQRPVRWEMRRVLMIATVLGVAGVVASFLLFWLADKVWDLPRETIQTLIFLKLTVAGHMTIYLARTGEQPFWTRPLPAPILFWTCEVTQALATLAAVYGLFMAPIGWGYAGLVWGYALGWFLVNDFIKVHVYRLMGHRLRRRDTARTGAA